MIGIYRIKPWFQKTLQPITNFLVAHKISPDWLTYGAIAVAGVMALALLAASNARIWLLVVAAGVVVRLALNALDGQVSRSLGYAGAWGEVKNELGDRVADALIFGALVFISQIPLTVSVAALIIALLTGYVGILSKAVSGVREYGGIMGKPDRMTVVALASLGVLLTGAWEIFTFALVLIILLGLWTIIVRLRAIYARI